MPELNERTHDADIANLPIKAQLTRALRLNELLGAYYLSLKI
jgi:hypothetical protein